MVTPGTVRAATAEEIASARLFVQEKRAREQTALATGPSIQPRRALPFIDPLGGVGRLGDLVGACRTKNGNPCGRRHEGVDLMAKGGTPVQSITGGVVIDSGWSKGLGGLMVKIRDNTGAVFEYFHLREDSAIPPPGALIEQGATIGLVGQTGTTSTDHLHLQVRQGGQIVDPMNILRGAIDVPASAFRGAIDVPAAAIGAVLDPVFASAGRERERDRNAPPTDYPQIGGVVSGMLEDVPVIGPIVKTAQAGTQAVAFLVDPGNWLRAGYFVLGIFVTWYGGKIILGSTGSPKLPSLPGSATVKKAAAAYTGGKVG